MIVHAMSLAYVQAGTTNGGENDEARRIAAYTEAAGAFVSMIE